MIKFINLFEPNDNEKEETKSFQFAEGLCMSNIETSQTGVGFPEHVDLAIKGCSKNLVIYL